MLLAPERNANFGELSLAVAKLRSEVGKSKLAGEAYQHAIETFQRKLAKQSTEQLWQNLVIASRGYGQVCRDQGLFGRAKEHLRSACEIAQLQANEQQDSLKWKLEWAMSETELGITLVAAAEFSAADRHLDSAAIRMTEISNAERPKLDLVGFETKFGNAAGNLAQAFRKRQRFDQAVAMQRIAVMQAGRLGDDELSHVKRSDAFADMALLLVLAGRPTAALRSLRQGISSIDLAIEISKTPDRYRQRRAMLKSHQARMTRRLNAAKLNQAENHSMID